MRQRTDRNESSRYKSTEPEILLRSSSATPEGAGEEKPRNPEWDRSARGAACTPEPSPEGPGRGERARPDAEQAHPERQCLHQNDWRGRRQRNSPHPLRDRGLRGGRGRSTGRRGRASRGRGPTAATLPTRAGPLPTSRPPMVPLWAGRLLSTLTSTGRSGRRGCTSRSRPIGSGHRRLASKSGRCWHRCGRGRHTSRTGGQKGRQNLTPLFHRSRQAEHQPDEVRERGRGKSGGATRNRRGGSHCQPRVAAIVGSNSSFRTVPVTPSRPPTPLPGPRTVSRRGAVMRPVAGPV